MDLNIDDKEVMMVAEHKKDDVQPEVKWNFYPNPVEDILYVTGLEGYYTIKIVDALGQAVASIKGASSEQVIDMSSRPSGMYLVKVQWQGKSFTRKLIKK